MGTTPKSRPKCSCISARRDYRVRSQHPRDAASRSNVKGQMTTEEAWGRRTPFLTPQFRRKNSSDVSLSGAKDGSRLSLEPGSSCVRSPSRSKQLDERIYRGGFLGAKHNEPDGAPVLFNAVVGMAKDATLLLRARDGRQSEMMRRPRLARTYNSYLPIAMNPATVGTDRRRRSIVNNPPSTVRRRRLVPAQTHSIPTAQFFWDCRGTPKAVVVHARRAKGAFARTPRTRQVRWHGNFFPDMAAHGSGTSSLSRSGGAARADT